MRYQNFSIRFQPSKDQKFSVDVTSPAGELSAEVCIPNELIENVDDVLREVGGSMRTLQVGPSKPRPRKTMHASTVGKQLFDAVFSDRILRLYQSSKTAVETTGQGLRIRLVMNPSEPSLATLNRLPWELMCDDEVTDEYLAISKFTPIVRYLEVPIAHTSLEFKPPFRVLVGMSNPEGVAALDLEEERARIEQGWGNRADVQVEFLLKTTRANLQRQLALKEYHVLHFMGHGDFNPSDGTGVLILENEDGTADFASGAAIGKLLKDEPTLRLVFLNACNTAKSSENENLDPFAGVASAMVITGVPAVIAMQFPITDKAAIVFSDKVYELLPQCLPIDTVVSEARKAVDQSQRSKGAMEWATPALFMRSDDGMIFESVFRSQEPLIGNEANQHARLTAKVRNAWIKGKLDRDIPMKPPIELDKELVPQATSRQVPSDEQETLPAGKAIGNLFDEKERSILILGEPGHGKTIALLALAEYLLERVERDPSEPIPVVLNLSTWPESKLSISDWAAREAFEIHHISDRLCKEWIQSGRIILLLDGLDLVEGESMDRCIAAINEFSRQRIRANGFHGLALCCRFDEYRRSQSRVDLEGAIKLQPLSEDQIRLYVQLCGEKMAGLQACLDRDPQLLEDARSPLMLGMMSMAYGLSPEKFKHTSNEFVDDTTEKERKQLITDTYLNHVFEEADRTDDPYQLAVETPSKQTAASGETFSRAQVLDGMSWLAKGMKRSHHSIFLIESLQPNWLPRIWQRFLTHVIFSLAMGSLVALTLLIAWKVSVHIDPPLMDPSADKDTLLGKHSPRTFLFQPEALRPHRWWFVVAPLFFLCASLWEVFQRHTVTRLLPHGSDRETTMAYTVLHYAIVFVVYNLIWNALWHIIGAFDAKTPIWYSHTFQSGVAVSALYTFRGPPPSTSNYVGTKETYRWSWASAVKGLVAGMILGSALALATYRFSGVTSLAFYLPLWCVTITFFVGYRQQPMKAKMRPNEGIRLSLGNALRGGAIFGPLIGGTLVFILMNAFPNTADICNQDATVEFRSVPMVSMTNLKHKLGPSLLVVIAATIVSFLWFGGIDVLRHYSLRLTLAITGKAPLQLANLCDQATKHILLQRIGGGYIFRNHLLRDHFEAIDRPPANDGADELSTRPSAPSESPSDR